MSTRQLIIFILTFSVFLSCKKSTPEENNKGGFMLIPSSNSGVTFNNKVKDQKDFNILTYRNFYNGGGVAIGDINNDGLKDIFFTANMLPNKLYLNKGNFTFEDISKNAGIEGAGAWSTGVTFTDVNQDGLLDIYVCNAGEVMEKNRRNELFINNGDETFTESATKFGLADTGYSTHAAFFDYDRDGDLDCFVLNNSYTNPDKVAKNASGKRQNYGTTGGDRLYEFDNGIFKDITQQAGLYSGDIDFGLGVSVGDINGDLFPDLYISNDFWERDYLYLNNQDGTFKEVLPDNMSYVSANSMGSDMADINNDGHLDIFSTDMLPASNYRMKSALKIEEFHLEDLKWRNSYFFQYVQNCLHLNNGDGTFKETAFFSKVAATDWSWGALIFDMNNDGLKDLFVSNGIYHDITDLDFVDFLADETQIKQIVKESGRVDFRDFVKHLPHNQQQNAAFINQDGIRFENQSAALHLNQDSYSNGAAYGDLDNDGDYDLVVNNVNMEAFLYKNNSVEQNGNNFIKFKLTGNTQNPFAIGTTVNIFYQDKLQTNQVMAARGFQSSVDTDIIFGLGKWSIIDSAQIIWNNGNVEMLYDVAPNEVVEIQQTTTKKHPIFQKEGRNEVFTNTSSFTFSTIPIHQENKYIDFDHERLLPHMLSKEGPKLLHGDINGDGQEDLLILGATHQPTVSYIYKEGKYVKIKQPYFELDKIGEDVCGALFDADNDGDLDLMIGIGGYEYQRGYDYFTVKMYTNDGKGNFIKELANAPNAKGHIGCIKPCDFDKDGDMDIFIGGRAVPGAYGLTPRSYLFRKDGDHTWTDITNEETGPIGMVTDALWTDLTNNDWQDLLVVGEWMPVTTFTNMQGIIQKDASIPNSEGWWNTIEAADIDMDGDTDYILGNWGLNKKVSATATKPLKIYVADFDRNGRQEGILEWYYGPDNKPFPFASKIDLVAQLPPLKKKTLKYKDYATTQISDIFSPSLLAQSIQKQVTTFNTSTLRKDEKGWELIPMPDEAQLSPVFGIEVADLDEDGHLDIFLGGNFYGLKPEMGRHDGFDGGYFKGDGKGEYVFISGTASGLKIKGAMRDVIYLNNQLLVARNNASVLSFRKK